MKITDTIYVLECGRKSEQLIQLTRTCRECSCRMFVLEQQISKLCVTYCLCHDVYIDAAVSVQQCVHAVTDDAIRVKALLIQALQRSGLDVFIDMLIEYIIQCIHNTMYS